MAHIYIGDKQSVDQEVMAKLQELPNEYWALGGVHMGREIDWLVIRAEEDRQTHSAIIVTELKRYNKPIRGISQDSVWQRQDADGNWQDIEAEQDRNPYWQAVNAANGIKFWMWNSQQIFLDHSQRSFQVPEDDFGAWPLVLILSPPGVNHQLPLRPTSRYGAWVYDLDRWFNSLQTWHPRKGVSLCAADMASLVRVLGLKRANDVPDDAETEYAHEMTLEDEVADLRQRLERLESIVSGR